MTECYNFLRLVDRDCIVKFVTSNKTGTRDVVLQTIKESGQVTVEELAQAADVSPVTVRHHVNVLQAEGLIEATAVRRKVGRPYYVYALSEKGQELFPKRYVSLTNRLLSELKSRLPADTVAEIFKGVVDGVITEHEGAFEHLSLEEKLDYLVQLLGKEGFLARWERDETSYKLIEYSCPYISVGSKHSDVCNIDKELMLNVLQLPVQQHSCMLEGADCCEFSVAAETIR